MRTDPTETGGLFVGRRPGTGPIRYRAIPPEGTKARRRVDVVVAFMLATLMGLISLSYWGPIPVLGLWVGSQIAYLTDSLGAGILSAFLLILALLMFGLVVLKRLDRMWILVRRSAGHDQTEGIIGRIFALTCAIGAVVFSIWLIGFSGAELSPVGIRF